MFRNKLISTIVLLVSLSSWAWAAGAGVVQATSKATGVPKIAVEPMIYNFGEIVILQSYTTEFTITNHGDGELVIDRVKTSCGCTAAKLSKKVLAPGESVQLEVKYTPNSSVLAVEKKVSIYTNDPAASPYVVRIKAFVSTLGKSVIIDPATWQVGAIKLNESLRRVFTVTNYSSGVVELDNADQGPVRVIMAGTKSLSANAATALQLEVKFKQPMAILNHRYPVSYKLANGKTETQYIVLKGAVVAPKGYKVFGTAATAPDVKRHGLLLANKGKTDYMIPAMILDFGRQKMPAGSLTEIVYRMKIADKRAVAGRKVRYIDVTLSVPIVEYD